MPAKMTKLGLAAPLAGLALLAAMAVETYSRPRPGAAEPYHRRVAEAAEQLPMTIGAWEGRDVPTPTEAIKLLKPNVIYNRRFTHRDLRQQVDVLVVQCKDARDIYGHYPPNCYPNNGYEMRGRRPADWRVEGLRVPGVEYLFTRSTFDRSSILVDNFILMPEGLIRRDMSEVGDRAWDYVRRFYGAAQVQVVFQDVTLDAERRAEIRREMLAAHMPIIQAIIGDIQ